jgi:hypothetical protein
MLYFLFDGDGEVGGTNFGRMAENPKFGAAHFLLNRGRSCEGPTARFGEDAQKAEVIELCNDGGMDMNRVEPFFQIAAQRKV